MPQSEEYYVDILILFMLFSTVGMIYNLLPAYYLRQYMTTNNQQFHNTCQLIVNSQDSSHTKSSPKMQPKFVIKSLRIIPSNPSLYHQPSHMHIPLAPKHHSAQQDELSWTNSIFDDAKLKQNFEAKLKTDDTTRLRFKFYRRNKVSKWQESGKQPIQQRRNLTPNTDHETLMKDRQIKTSQNYRQAQSSPQQELRQQQFSFELAHSAKIPPSYQSMQFRSKNIEKISSHLQLPQNNNHLNLSAGKLDHPRFKRLSRRFFIGAFKDSSIIESAKTNIRKCQKDGETKLLFRDDRGKEEGWSLSDDEDNMVDIDSDNIFAYMRSRKLEGEGSLVRKQKLKKKR